MSPDFLSYHLLGVLCWLYPVGYPRRGTYSVAGGGGGGEGLAVWEERCDEIAPPRRHLADCRRQEREMEARGPRRRRHRLLHLLCDGVRVELVRREPRGKFDGKKLVGGMCLRLLVASECMQ